eukprot:4923218-Prymnesium_polylepis.1
MVKTACRDGCVGARPPRTSAKGEHSATRSHAAAVISPPPSLVARRAALRRRFVAPAASPAHSPLPVFTPP